MASTDVTQVMATPGLDGSVLDRAIGGPASGGASLFFGPGAEVSSGSGSWAQPVEVDAYPLIGTVAGIEALNQGRGLPEVEPMAAEGGATAGTAATDTTVAGTTQNQPAGPVSPPECPALGAPSGPPETVGPCGTSTTVTAPPTVTAPVTVTMAPRQIRIDGAELVLEPLAGTDGATWLIPAYRFTSSTTTGTWTVLAIDRKWFDPGGRAGSGPGTTGTTDTGGGVSGGSSGSSPGSPPTTPIPPTGSPDPTAVPLTSAPHG